MQIHNFISNYLTNFSATSFGFLMFAEVRDVSNVPAESKTALVLILTIVIPAVCSMLVTITVEFFKMKIANKKAELDHRRQLELHKSICINNKNESEK